MENNNPLNILASVAAMGDICDPCTVGKKRKERSRGSGGSRLKKSMALVALNVNRAEKRRIVGGLYTEKPGTRGYSYYFCKDHQDCKYKLYAVETKASVLLDRKDPKRLFDLYSEGSHSSEALECERGIHQEVFSKVRE
jgi:hypothetical protein